MATCAQGNKRLFRVHTTLHNFPVWVFTSRSEGGTVWEIQSTYARPSLKLMHNIKTNECSSWIHLQRLQPFFSRLIVLRKSYCRLVSFAMAPILTTNNIPRLFSLLAIFAQLRAETEAKSVMTVRRTTSVFSGRNLYCFMYRVQVDKRPFLASTKNASLLTL